MMAKNESNIGFASDRVFLLQISILLVALLVVMVFAAGAGAVQIPGRAGVSILWGRFERPHVPPHWPSTDEVILLHIRFPRVLGAALVGAALSVAGTLFQGLLRNPMADPFILGTSRGGPAGGRVGLLLATHVSVLGFGAVPALAFLGALGAMVVVYRLSRIGGQTSLVNLLLAGFATIGVLSYAMSLILILNDRLQLNTRVVYAWLLGGIALSRWSQVGLIALLVLSGTALACAFGRSLNALSLGDETAQQLGIHVERHRAAIIAVGAVLTPAAVSGGGLIGFFGLIVPHFVRLIFGPNHIRLVPLSALGGATFLVLADL